MKQEQNNITSTKHTDNGHNTMQGQQLPNEGTM